MRNDNTELRRALKASLRLQAKYAAELNKLDNAGRPIFPDADVWIAYIRDIDERARALFGELNTPLTRETPEPPARGLKAPNSYK